ncbi:flagellar basal-body rod protein FlgF [Candidatus Bandiella numerosa]|uniref:flagellar basal-body rod protein FlgF n=1 Tax=Candidatus Bandiella numerosa TaxID=2570586 RepID=UPI00249EEF3F|nr:flagellar basal-body rod protein FlgF [Candidatus Bandiella numerosa]WHA04925.1 flagellar basal-body rod protein FlgF [Candidatus Bandiella numerosa]
MVIIIKLENISILAKYVAICIIVFGVYLFTLMQVSLAMDNSIYATLSNQVALNDELSITANNMANANTTGFKKDLQIMSSYVTKDKIADLKMPNDIASISDFTPGSLNQTGRPFDIAINGEGFFMIETPNGNFYTRNGRFLINNEGALIDQHGNYVLSDDGGQIAVPLQNESVHINRNGNIYISENFIGNIGVFNFSDVKLLRKAGNNYFKTKLEGIPSEKYQLLQGFLEESNTSPIIETTKLIDLQKKFSMSSNLITDVYGMQRNSFRVISK